MGAPTGSATRVHNSPSSQALMWRATTRGLPVPSSPLATQPLTQKVKTWMGAACVQVYPRSTIHLQLSRRPQTLPPTAPVTTAITSRGAVKVPPAKPTSVQMPVSPSRFSPGWKNRGKTPNRKTLPLAQVHCSALLTIHFPNLWGNRATVQRGLFWRKDRGEGSSKDPGAGHDPKATSHTHRLCWPNPWFLLNITRAPRGSAARQLYTANVWSCRCRHPVMCTPDQSRDEKAECLFSSFLSASRHRSKHSALWLCVPIGSICINTRIFLHAYTHASLMQSQIKNQYGNSTVVTNVFT